MICNELYDGQGLGNQLWNYAVARIIAKQKKCDFSILGREKFKGREFMEIDFGAKLTGGLSPEGGPPSRLPFGIHHYYRERAENLPGRNVNISRTDPNLFKIPLNTKFDGNCQSTRYLEGYRNDILGWIKIKDQFKNPSISENACIIHMRCGDFASIKDVFLPSSYYRNAIEHIKKNNKEVKFYYVTDQKEIAAKILPEVEIAGSAVLEKKDEHKASHHYGGPISIDFNLLMNAKYMIIPNSSFSWWAAYLNTNKNIVIAPKYWAGFNESNGYWSTSDIITDGFTYLDRNGKFFSSKECWIEKDKFESAHQEIFTPKTIFSKVKNKLKKIFKKRTDFPLLESVALQNMCDYSFGDHSGVLGRIPGAFMKKANMGNEEFLAKYREIKKTRNYMTLFIDNIRLYRRPIEYSDWLHMKPVPPSDRAWLDTMLDEDLLDLCSKLPDMKFIIFTALEDTPLDSYIRIPENVLSINAANAVYFGGKIVPYPHGLERKMYKGYNHHEILQRFLLDNRQAKKGGPLLYVNHRNDTGNRGSLRDMFSNKKWATVSPRADYKTYLTAIKNHKFVLCPSGNGIGSARNWETLYLRRVPVFERHPYKEVLFKDFPVLFVDNYSEVTEELLNKNEHLYQEALKIDFDKLNLIKVFNERIKKSL